MDSVGSFQLGTFYDAFPCVESEFQAALDESSTPKAAHGRGRPKLGDERATLAEYWR